MQDSVVNPIDLTALNQNLSVWGCAFYLRLIRELPSHGNQVELNTKLLDARFGPGNLHTTGCLILATIPGAMSWRSHWRSVNDMANNIASSARQ